MRLRTPLDLGLVPFRDHRDQVGPSRALFSPSRIDGRYTPRGYRLVDRESRTSPKHLAVEPGDEQGYYFWAPGRTATAGATVADGIAGRRPTGSWWGAGAAAAIVESADATGISTGTFGVVSTPSGRENVRRVGALGVLPYLDRSLALDDRYAELRVVGGPPPAIRPKESDTRIRVVLPFPERELPADHPGTVHAGTEEHAQETLFVPAGGVLVSHWRPDGPNRFSTLCYDVQGSRLNPDRAGPLDTAWRVTSLELPDFDLPRHPRIRPVAGLAWVGLESPEHPRSGRCLTAHMDVDPYDLEAVVSSRIANVYHAAEGGGPLTAGGPGCQHRFFANADGEPFSPGHLWKDTLFWAGPGFDAPLDFELREYPSPPPGPYLARVHLVHDSRIGHLWRAGDRLDVRTGRGLWRWYAETIWGPYDPPKEPPTRPPPPATPPPPTVVRPPPPAVGPPPPAKVPDRSGRGEPRGEPRQKKPLWTLGDARAQKKWFDAAGGRVPAAPNRGLPGVGGGANGKAAVVPAGKAPGAKFDPKARANPGQQRRRWFGAGVLDFAQWLGAGQRNVNRPGEFGGFPDRPEVGGAQIIPPDSRRRFQAGPQGAGEPAGVQVIPPGSRRRFQAGPQGAGEPAGVQFNVPGGTLFLEAEAPTFQYTPSEIANGSTVGIPARTWVREEDFRYKSSPHSAAERAAAQSAPATSRLQAFGVCNAGDSTLPNWDFTWPARIGTSKTLSGTGDGGLAFLPPEWGLEDVLCGRPQTFHRRRAKSSTKLAFLGTALGFFDCYDPRYGAVDGYDLSRDTDGAILIRSISSAGVVGSTTWSVSFNGTNLNLKTSGTGTVQRNGASITGDGTIVTTATYTTTDSDAVLFCDGDTPASNIAVSFVAASSANKGRVLMVKNYGTPAGGRNVTYTSFDTLGSSSLKTLIPGSSGYVSSDGSNWYTV